jgi:hypothetical protein
VNATNIAMIAAECVAKCPYHRLPKWYFDNFEKRCMPFYFGGCEGRLPYFLPLTVNLKTDA